MMHQRNIVVTVLSIGAMMFLVSPAFAETTPAGPPSCECYCATKDGAKIPDGGQKTTTANCKTLCEKIKTKVVVCAAAPTERPESNLKCFTKKECETDQCKAGARDTTTARCDFDAYQPPECPPGKHYCYRRGEPYKLGVPLLTQDLTGEVKQVIHLGDYVSVFYNFLLGASVFFAIVMIMIGGMQYVAGAGAGEVGHAKERIRNAVIGLVLLLACALLLQTVNPRLLRLEPPSLPMIKQIIVLGPGQDCATLEKQGFKVDKSTIKQGKYGAEGCGSTATITADQRGNPLSNTCTFTKCPNEQDGCLSNGVNSICARCGSIIPEEIDKTGIKPSSATCNALKAQDKTLSDNTLQVKNYCFYTHDPGVIVSGWEVVGSGTAITAATVFSGGLLGGIAGAGIAADQADDIYTGSCAELSIDCSKVKRCSDYNSDGLQVVTKESDQELNDLFIDPIWGEINLKKICEVENPCKIANCVYNTATTECRSPGEGV